MPVWAQIVGWWLLLSIQTGLVVGRCLARSDGKPAAGRT